jgi:molybdate transport system substrate-binding protein
MKSLTKGALAMGALLLLSASVAMGEGKPAPAPTPAPAPAATRPRLTLAAASDMKFALDGLLKEFRARHPDADIEATYGSSGNFLAQISQGAPFDVFLSADVAYPRKLVEQGLVVDDAVFLYGVGRLVLWVPRDSPLDVEKKGLEVLREPAARRIAIANPQHAPYGRAAQAALESQGLAAVVKERLVLGENIAQTAQFVQSGAADVGLIAMALALAPAMKDAGRYAEVPLTAYPRMDQGGAILKGTKQLELARQFREMLLSAKGKELLRSYGFYMPGE